MFEKKLSIKNDFIITGLNGIGTVIGIFLVSGYLARSLGLDVLGEYLLLRRLVTAFLGVLLIGMNVTIPVLIAKNPNSAIGDASIVIFLFITTLIAPFFIASFANLCPSVFFPFIAKNKLFFFKVFELIDTPL